MKKYHRIVLIFLIMISCIAVDQATKEFARTYLEGKPSISFIYNTITLRLVHNDGAFLSMLSFLSKNMKILLLQLGVSIVLALLIVYMITQKSLTMHELLAYSLFTGGGISNLIDRILRDGYVTDFLKFGIGTLRTGILNIADIQITAGVVILLVYGIFLNTKKEPVNKEPEQGNTGKIDL